MTEVILSCHGHRRLRLSRVWIVAKITANCVNNWFLGYFGFFVSTKRLQDHSYTASF